MKFSKVCTILQLNREITCGVNLVLPAIVRVLMRLIQSWNTDVHWFNKHFIYSIFQSIAFSAQSCRLYVSITATAIVLAFYLNQRYILLAPYGCPSSCIFPSISSWHAEYVYLELVSSCTFHMLLLYVICNSDLWNSEA